MTRIGLSSIWGGLGWSLGNWGMEINYLEEGDYMPIRWKELQQRARPTQDDLCKTLFDFR